MPEPWYKTLHWEKWHPTYLCLLGAAAVLVARRYLKVSETERLAVLSSIITAASIIFGFIGTVMTILATFFDKRVMKNLAALGAHRNLLRYFMHSLYALCVVIGISLLLTFSYWRNWWGDTVMLAILGTSVAYGILSIMRLRKPLLQLAEKLNPEPPKVLPPEEHKIEKKG